MDLRQAVSDRLQSMIDSGQIDKMIEVQLADTIKGVLRDSMRSYSEFGKNLKEKLETALKLDFNNLGLPSYNDVVIKLVREYTNRAMQEQGAKQLEEHLKNLFGDFGTEVSFRQLMEDLLSLYEKEQRENGWARPSVHLETQYCKNEDEDNPTTFWLYFDPEPRKKSYECKYSLYISDGQVSSIRLEERDFESQLFLGPKYDFERKLLQMYLSKPKFKLDAYPDDIFYPDPY